MSAKTDIKFDVRGHAGFVTLNRPKALNALTLPMIEAMDARLTAWATDPGIDVVVVRGTGEKAFCAGGDVRAIWQAGKDGDPLTRDFFRAEYHLNRRIKIYPKPYVALIDGVTMGGGVGVSVHGSQRVATEHTLFAMPETRIGLFPDVGGTHFLPRLAGKLGLYLGLTGARLKAADALHAGVATHYVDSERLPDLEEALAEAGADVSAALAGFTSNPGPALLAEHRATIDRCFAGVTVEGIMAALEDEGGGWAETALTALRAASPTSLKITIEALRRGAKLDFDGSMTMEFRLSQACLARHDSYEGIRAALVDKDNAPIWQPAKLADVSAEQVAAHFAPPPDGDLTFD
ncbi:MAG: enoyl-CoA hydratase/isomerase family protein [Alphaproteobacteria bacterium]